MSRDYKNVPRDQGGPGWSAAILPFLTGLAVGAAGALVLFLNLSDVTYSPFRSGDATARTVGEATRTRTEPAPAPAKPAAVPKFDFYNILPNKEINISEWVAGDKVTEPPAIEAGGLYVLQVGSFKQPEAADQVKARLALLGIAADIQRVVLNGRESLYRVRVGPYEDRQKLDQERRRLQDNNLEYMLLKLE